MINLSTIIGIVVVYFAALFAIAVYVERKYEQGKNLTNNAAIYTLSLAIYATAWTFYGNVGLAATTSYAFLGIYIGPTLAMIFGWPVIRKLIRIKNEYGVASISGFLSARYDRSYGVGVIATLIALFGITPYFALQFKAIFQSFSFMVSGGGEYDSGLIRLTVVGMVILFTIVFGFRKLEQTERHPGMVMVVAIQSIIKIVAFLAVGLFVTFFLFDGFFDMFAQIRANAPLLEAVNAGKPEYSLFLSYIIISMFAIVLLPRQFHLAVVENSDERHVRTAAWALPVYLFLITAFVFPIAMAGILKGYDMALSDLFILLVSAMAKHTWLAILVFIGGLSAAFSMIMVSTVAITTMVANNVLVPIIEKIPQFGFLRKRLLPLRWGIVVFILLMGYVFELLTGESYILVKIGIISFAAVLQFAPAVIGGLYWERGNRAGALAGLLGGFAVWIHTSLVPAFVRSGWLPDSMLSEGPFGLGFLRPENLFGVTVLDPLSMTIIFTIIVNVGLYIVVSLLTRQNDEEKRTAYNFVNIIRGGGKFLLPDVAQKEYIDLEAKKKTAFLVFSKYLNGQQALEETEKCVKKAGLEGKKMISINALIELENSVENTLAGFIGSPAARDALERESLFSPEEAAQLSNIYSKMAADVKITPEEFVQKIAEQKLLSQSKNNFMAIASHEMRTPLTVIRGNAELMLQELKAKPENKEAIKSLSAIQRNSVRLLDIIHDFIDVMQLEESNIEVEKEEFDIVQLTRDVVADLGPVAAEKKLYIKLEEPPEPILMVVADPGKTRQVIVNLIGNAVHYTGVGGITITIAQVADPNGRFMKVSVIDTGAGISSEGQKMLFQKFSTIQKTFLHTKEYGSGLGLYISKLFTEAMGGSIRLEKSVPKEGSTFAILLPIAPQPDKKTEK